MPTYKLIVAIKSPKMSGQYGRMLAEHAARGIHVLAADRTRRLTVWPLAAPGSRSALRQAA
jgi:hypothetical protein